VAAARPVQVAASVPVPVTVAAARPVQVAPQPVHTVGGPRPVPVEVLSAAPSNSPAAFTQQLVHAVPPQEHGMVNDIQDFQMALDAVEVAQALVSEHQAGDSSAPENQFTELLESLEARVDLMSQMQLTRAAIQRRTQEIEEQKVVELEEPLPDEINVPIGSRRSTGMETEMRAQFQDQRESITRLASEVRDMRRKLLALGSEPDVAVPSGSVEDTDEQPITGYDSHAVFATAPADSLDDTQPVSAVLDRFLQERAARPSADAGSAAAHPELPDFVLPFSTDVCGVNLSISEDGYAATRMRGCRQSVAIGSGPLPRQSWGYYFEVLVQETVAGWVGGLGIGVTSTSPGSLRRVPDKAWRLPDSYIVGYWGCIFLDGKEHRTVWRSDALCPGSRVGLLVTGDGRGDLIVFVNDRPVVRMDGALLGDGVGPSTSGLLLYPVVDIFAATRMVVLSQHASPPPPPWYVDESLVRPSAPGSPATANRSIHAASIVGTPSCV